VEKKKYYKAVGYHLLERNARLENVFLHKLNSQRRGIEGRFSVAVLVIIAMKTTVCPITSQDGLEMIQLMITFLHKNKI
jgi:hypothetical protein